MTSETDAEKLARLQAEHDRGLERVSLRITSIARPTEHLIRITGALSQVSDSEAWAIPNVAIRLALPGLDGGQVSRVYTVRRFMDGEIEIDFVVHPEPSPVMAWLEKVQVGDEVGIVGPRHHMLPHFEGASKALLFADSTGIPAVYSILCQWPEAMPGAVVIATEDVSAVEELRRLPQVPIDVITPQGNGDGVLLSAAQAASYDGNTTVWAAGEREEMRRLRTFLRDDSGLSPEHLRIFSYWKRGVSNSELDNSRSRFVRELALRDQLSNGYDDLDVPI